MATQQKHRKHTKLDASNTGIEPQLLDIRQSGSFLGTTIYQVRQLIWANRLTAVRLGHRLLVNRDELKRFVDSLSS